MISFCQDLHVSHQYYICQGKPVKKRVKHTRNNSTLSEKVLDKAKKLELVSKNSRQNIVINKGIKISNPEKHFYNHLKNMKTNNKSLPNQKPNSSKNIQQSLNARQYVPVQIYQTKANHSHQRRPNSQLEYYKQYSYERVPQTRAFNFFNDSSTPASNLSRNQTSNLSISEQKTIKIKDWQFELNSSIESNTATKKGIQLNNAQNVKVTPRKYHLRTASLQINQTELFQDNFNAHKSKELQTLNNTLTVSNPKQSAKIEESYEQQSQSKGSNFKTFSRQDMYDIESLVSGTVDSEQVQNCSDSFVEQRNFLCEEGENSPKIFRKNIGNYLRTSVRVQVECEGWNIYRAVDTQTQKQYSIKQFSQFHRSQYQEQYQLYLSLANLYSNQIDTCFLKLFNALKDRQQKIFNLIKQPYRETLRQNFAQKSTYELQHNHNVALPSIPSVMNRIKQLIEQIEVKYQMRLKSNHEYRIDDFVFVNGEELKLKFHSIFKLKFKDSHSKELTNAVFKKKRIGLEQSKLIKQSSAKIQQTLDNLKKQLLEKTPNKSHQIYKNIAKNQ